MFVCLFVCLSACLSVNFFFVKDSATTWVRILKFGRRLDIYKVCISDYINKFCIVLYCIDSDELYCVTKEQPHIAYQSLYLYIFLSLQWKKIFVKDFSATTWVRILKFGTKLDSDELYCVRKEQPHIAYQSLYLFIFLSLQWKFLSKISQLLLQPVFSNFVYIFRMAKCTA